MEYAGPVDFKIVNVPYAYTEFVFLNVVKFQTLLIFYAHLKLDKFRAKYPFFFLFQHSLAQTRSIARDMVRIYKRK